jgi:hypothetical protein
MGDKMIYLISDGEYSAYWIQAVIDTDLPKEKIIQLMKDAREESIRLDSEHQERIYTRLKEMGYKIKRGAMSCYEIGCTGEVWRDVYLASLPPGTSHIPCKTDLFIEKCKENGITVINNDEINWEDI